MIKKSLIVSLMLNFILLIALSYFIYEMGFSNVTDKMVSLVTSNEIESEQKPVYQGRYSIFKGQESSKGDTVFLGDSLIKNNEWSEFFNTNGNIYNSGIGGDTTYGVLSRINQIAKIKPSKLFIMVGINDLNIGIPINETISNYKKLVDTMKQNSPDTAIFIQSVLPINADLTSLEIGNDEIAKLNESLKNLSDKEGVTYVDVNSLVCDNNELNKNLTVDGIHLNGKGYLIWVKELKKYINIWPSFVIT